MMKDEYVKKEDAINALEEKEHEPWYLHKDLEWMSGVVEAKDEIKSLEPADVVPVVHAYWRDTGSGQECSACKEIQYGYDTGRHYCPNCGAKMDKEQEHD